LAASADFDSVAAAKQTDLQMGTKHRADSAETVPPVDRTIPLIRRRTRVWRREGRRIALVPTMGALHQGHLSLVRAGKESADRVVVSIFVNPTQFAPNEDFAAYPRDLAADLAKLAELGVDAVFAPAAAVMYPEGFATTVTISGPAEGLESASRPHFFRGVTTVVAKLLLSIEPDIAFFGEKDYQQLVVIRRMVADLAIPAEIRGFPTVREPDGLALSSRNVYLSAAERLVAPRLYQALQEAAEAIRAGHAAAAAVDHARTALAAVGFAVDYVELRNAETLAVVGDPLGELLRLLAAARLGKTRLIDNVPV
jgi:pantoate--beta-alanine ligase